MRISTKRLITILVPTILLTAGVLWLFRDSLAVHYHLRALHRAEQEMFAPPPSTLRQQVLAFLTRRPSWGAWSEARDYHEQALVRLG